MLDFDQVFERTVGLEGAYTAGAGDPGGETQWGISKREYPQVDIKGLAREDAKAIYRRDFWAPIERLAGEAMAPAIAYQVFDAAFNHGQGNAVRMLQAALGVAPDGHFGPVSAAALRALPTAVVLMRLLAARLRFMAHLTTFERFGRGWANRIATDLDYAAQDEAAA
jgi:lysozyme family protein